MRNQILTICLNPAVDRIKIPAKHSQKAHSRQEEIVSAGGKGLNVSRALNCLGAKTLATGIVAGATGRSLCKMLDEEGISHDFLWVSGETRTNITVMNASSRHPARTIGSGPTADERVIGCFEKKLKRLLRGCSFVALSGRNANGSPKDTYARLIRLIKKAKIKTALDTGSADLRESLSAMPEIIKPNIEEAEATLGRRLTTFKKLKDAVNEFHHLGIRSVLLTLAERGALGCSGGRIWHCRVPKIRGQHGLGCGDAFLAGFLFASMQGYNFPDALRFAGSCGTINCRAQIPGKIDKSEVLALLKGITIKEETF